MPVRLANNALYYFVVAFIKIKFVFEFMIVWYLALILIVVTFKSSALNFS